MRKATVAVVTALSLLALWVFSPGIGIMALGLRPSPLLGELIAVDPGHGGHDSGAYHPESGIKEKDLTLDIAVRLESLLLAAGARPLMTRRTDEMHGNYMQDLGRRVQMIQEAGARVTVSIHVNEFPDPSCQGGQVFYRPGCQESRRLAHLIQEELRGLQPDNLRQPAAMSYYMLASVSSEASVLVEAGFLTNPIDRENLVREDYRQKVALVLLRALSQYSMGQLPQGLR